MEQSMIYFGRKNPMAVTGPCNLTQHSERTQDKDSKHWLAVKNAHHLYKLI